MPLTHVQFFHIPGAPLPFQLVTTAIRQAIQMTSVMGSVKQQLSAVTAKPEFEALQKEHLVCVVQRVSSETAEDSTVSADAPTHALYITAYLPSISGGPSFCLQSPCAILDVFVGSENDTTAPEWMHWSKPSLIFQHRTASFAELFINAATSRFNAEQPGLSLQMIAWARSVKATMFGLCPKTPQTLQFFPNTPAPRRILYDIDDSPTIAQCGIKFDTECFGGDSEANWESESVVRSLDFGQPPSPKDAGGAQPCAQWNDLLF